MDILLFEEKMKVLTDEKKANFIRHEILKNKIQVLDIGLDFTSLPTVALDIKFSNVDFLKDFLDNSFPWILDKSLMRSDGNMQTVTFLNSHIYVFAKSLKWGKIYPLKTKITFQILQKEFIESKKRKRIDKKIKQLNN